MDNLNWQGVVFIIIALFIGGVIGYSVAPSERTGLTDKEVETRVNDAVFQKNAEIETLKGRIEELENKTIEDENKTAEEKEEEKKLLGYLIDELYLSTPLNETYSDREISTLFDGEVEFDGKNYDAEETLIVEGIELLANENDFEGKVYMTIPEGAIEYKLKFESNLNTSLIGEDDETLEFNLLGKRVEISAWDNNVITIFKGTEMFVDENEIVDFEDYTIILISVTDDSVYLSVTDSEGDIETKIIDEDKTRTVNGLKIRVEDVFSSGTKSFAELVIGTDIETEIVDGEEYEEDSIWEWKISANSIGIVLIEDFTEIDKDDEEFPAVGVDEKLCLPNEYVCIQFNGMVEEDSEEYTFELDTEDELEYVRVDGNFQSGIDDYDRIYINPTGIYDRDLVSIGKEIELGDSDLVLSLNITTGMIVIEDFEVNFALNETSATGDENFLTNYGILVENPEDSCYDQEFKITVPEERLEGSISLI